MSNDQGFSKIITVIIAIIIIVLIVTVVILKNASQNDEYDLVNIHEQELFENLPIKVTPVDLFLFKSAGGSLRQLEVHDLTSEQVFDSGDDLNYHILSDQLGQGKILLTVDIWQHRDQGGQDLWILDLLTGVENKIFTLPNVQVGEFTRFISSAVFSPDQTKIAYVTHLFDFSEERSDKLEVWEYNLTKDIHTLLVQLSGVVMGELEVVGYQNDLSKLILYQYTADGAGYYTGQVRFINLASKEISENGFQIAMDTYFNQTSVSDYRIKTLGRPYLAPTGDWLAFVVPAEYYEGERKDSSRTVVLYDLKSHQIKSIYKQEEFAERGNFWEWQRIDQLVWKDGNLYIPAVGNLLAYNISTGKLRSVYQTSVPENDLEAYRYQVLAINDNGLVTKTRLGGLVSYLSFVEARVYDLPAGDFSYAFIKINNQ